MVSSKQRKYTGCLLTGLLALSFACTNPTTTDRAEQETTQKNNLEISRADFGSLNDGTPVDLFTLKNSNGLETKITNFGGIITSLRIPDRDGRVEEVVLGYDSLSGYLQDGVPYFGAIIGRFGNRIAAGKFSLDGQEYTLAVNSGTNQLHGGLKGFDKVVWQAEEFQNDDAVGVKLAYVSKDMEEGYPGTLTTEVIYTLNNDNELIIDYKASTDKTTVVNLTNHSYFNFSGNVKSNVLEHKLMINGDSFVPVDQNLIPIGELHPVEGTPLDFREPTKVGKNINAGHEQLVLAGGYDHTWVLGEPGQLKLAATLHEPANGRFMEVFTTEPGVQFYAGNFLGGGLKRRDGEAFQKREGLCLETQHFPDSPNQPQFPSTELKPGETYQSQTIHRFSVK